MAKLTLDLMASGRNDDFFAPENDNSFILLVHDIEVVSDEDVPPVVDRDPIDNLQARDDILRRGVQGR